MRLSLLELQNPLHCLPSGGSSKIFQNTPEGSTLSSQSSRMTTTCRLQSRSRHRETIDFRENHITPNQASFLTTATNHDY